MAYGPTVFLGVVFFLMPFFPEPHIVEKIRMFSAGAGLDPRAWLDIVLHFTAGFFALTKHLRHRKLCAAGLVAEGDRNAAPAEKYEGIVNPSTAVLDEAAAKVDAQTKPTPSTD